MVPISVPTEKPQPNLARYGLDWLEVVTRYTYDSYMKAFGVPPPCNPNLPLKSWFDSTKAANNRLEYAFYSQLIKAADPNDPTKNVMTFKPLILTEADAASINIPPPQNKGVDPNAIILHNTIGVPVRGLKANEEFEAGATGMGLWVIHRTDIPDPEPGSADEFQQTVLTLLHQIAAAVTKG